MDKERKFHLLKQPIIPLVESDPDIIDLSSTSHDESDSHIIISDSESEIEKVEKIKKGHELKNINDKHINELHVVEHDSKENDKKFDKNNTDSFKNSTNEIKELDKHFQGNIRSIGVNENNLLPVEKALNQKHIPKLKVDKDIYQNRPIDAHTKSDFKSFDEELASQFPLNESTQKIKNDRGVISSVSTQESSESKKESSSFISDICNGLSKVTTILNFFGEDKNNKKQVNSKDNIISSHEIENSRTNSIIIDESEPIKEVTTKPIHFSKSPKKSKTSSRMNPQEGDITPTPNSRSTQSMEIVVDSTCSSSNQPLLQSQSQLVSQSQVLSQLPTQTQKLTQTQLLQTQIQIPSQVFPDLVNEVDDSSSNINMKNSTKAATTKKLTPLPKHPQIRAKNPSIQLSPEQKRVPPDNRFTTSNLDNKQTSEQSSSKSIDQSSRINDSFKVSSERDAILKIKIPKKIKKIPKLRSMKLRQRAESTDDEIVSDDDSDNNIRPFRPSSGKRIISNGLLPISTDKISKITTSQVFTKEEIGFVDNLTLKSSGGLFDDDDKTDDVNFNKDNTAEVNNDQRKVKNLPPNSGEINNKNNITSMNNLESDDEQHFESSKRKKTDRVMNFDAIPLESSDYENNTSTMMENPLATQSALGDTTKNKINSHHTFQNFNLAKSDAYKSEQDVNPVIIDAVKETENRNDNLSQATQSTAAIDGLLNYYENEYFNNGSETESPKKNNYQNHEKPRDYHNLFVPEDESEHSSGIDYNEYHPLEYLYLNNNLLSPGEKNEIDTLGTPGLIICKRAPDSEKNRKFRRLMKLREEKRNKRSNDYDPYSSSSSSNSSEDEYDKNARDRNKSEQQFVVDDDAIEYESEEDSGDELTKIEKIKHTSKLKTSQFKNGIRKRPRINESDEDDHEKMRKNIVTKKRRGKRSNILKDLEFSDNEFCDLDNLDRRSRRNKNVASLPSKKESIFDRPLNENKEKPSVLNDTNIIILDSESDDDIVQDTKIRKEGSNQNIRKSPTHVTSNIEQKSLVLYKTRLNKPTNCIHCTGNQSAVLGNSCDKNEPCNNCVVRGLAPVYTNEKAGHNMKENIEQHRSCLTCQRNPLPNVKKSCNGKEPCNNCRELKLPCGYTRESLQKKIDNGAGYNRSMKPKRNLKKKKFSHKSSYDSTLLDNMNKRLINRHKQRKKNSR